MPQMEFRCVACHGVFTVPSELIPKTGGRGKCTGCGAALVIYPDGRVTRPSATPSPVPQERGKLPEIGDEPRWEVRPAVPESPLLPGSYPLPEIRRLIKEGLLFEGDLARIPGTDWQPARAYPALMQIFLEVLQEEKERHGDEDHCHLHRDTAPGWRCPRCKDYLCRECVVNRPLLAGGADHFVCLACESELEPVKRKVLKGIVPGIFKKG